MKMISEEQKILDMLNKQNEERHTSKWVVSSPNYFLISTSKEELEKFLESKGPYQYKNATYRFPAKEEDFYKFWEWNQDLVLRRESIISRVWDAIIG
jgi:hypothetical protein